MIALLCLLALPARFLWASTGTEGASFLDIPVGAGPAALGSAYTPLATNAADSSLGTDADHDCGRRAHHALLCPAAAVSRRSTAVNRESTSAVR